jgi:hypothetical protein
MMRPSGSGILQLEWRAEMMTDGRVDGGWSNSWYVVEFRARSPSSRRMPEFVAVALVDSYGIWRRWKY